MLQVRLDPGLPDGRFACLRPLCGHDEAAVDDCSDLAATHLLDHLLVDAPGTRVGPGRAWELPVSDRDRLLAALYRHYYGDRVEGNVDCRTCGKSFDLAFDLTELTSALEWRETSLATDPDSESSYTMNDGRRFRLPTAEDQRSVVGVGLEKATTTLLERCLLEGDATDDRERLEAAMAAVGPILDLDLDATCPECGARQAIHFDICAHLLGALASERVWLTHEVHTIASAYGWSLAEILGLPREDRRAYVRLIEAHRPKRQSSSP